MHLNMQHLLPHASQNATISASCNSICNNFYLVRMNIQQLLPHASQNAATSESCILICNNFFLHLNMQQLLPHASQYATTSASCISICYNYCLVHLNSESQNTTTNSRWPPFCSKWTQRSILYTTTTTTTISASCTLQCMQTEIVLLMLFKTIMDNRTETLNNLIGI